MDPRLASFPEAAPSRQSEGRHDGFHSRSVQGRLGFARVRPPREGVLSPQPPMRAGRNPS